MKNHRTRLALTVSVILLGLTACSSPAFIDAPTPAETAVAATSAENSVDRNLAIASCGVMVRLLNGDLPINSTTYSEAEKTLRTFAESGPGEVKTTAQFVLDRLDGKEHTEAQSEEQVQKLKDYCVNYTVD
jgi:hypothetical protein